MNMEARPVLLVDDDPHALRAAERVVKRYAPVISVSTATAGFDVLVRVNPAGMMDPLRSGDPIPLCS
jgi:hypothetical protein